MNLIYLKYFVSVAQIGSINQSANELFISPQGLSRAIRQLEADMDATLFIRDKEGLTLTPEGEMAYDYALKILKLQEEMAFGITELAQEKSGMQTLNISAYPIISSVFFPQILPKLFKKMPGTRLQIHYASDFELVSQLDAKAADIIVFTTPVKANALNFQNIDEVWSYEHLCTTTIVALTPKNSPVSENAMLTEEVFLESQKVFFGNADTLVQRMGFKTDAPILKTSDYSLFRSVLSANPQAIGLSDTVVENGFTDKSLKTLSLPLEIQMEYSCFIQKKSANIPATKEFVRLLKKALNTDN